MKTYRVVTIIVEIIRNQIIFGHAPLDIHIFLRVINLNMSFLSEYANIVACHLKVRKSERASIVRQRVGIHGSASLSG
jgi:hypothetical protein